LITAFGAFTERDTRTLIHLLIAGVAFAIDNRLGNKGLTVLALVSIIAGAGMRCLSFNGASAMASNKARWPDVPGMTGLRTVVAYYAKC